MTEACLKMGIMISRFFFGVAYSTLILKNLFFLLYIASKEIEIRNKYVSVNWVSESTDLLTYSKDTSNTQIYLIS